MASLSQLVCFLLFWSLSVVLARTATIENPLKESIGEAQDKLLNAQSTIIRIHAGELIAESLEELKVRLSLLQVEIEKLIVSTNGRSAESEACMAAMNNLTNSYHTIDSQLRGLQMEFEKHNTFENRTLLFRDILADIRSKRFWLADEKFMLLNDLSVIPKIVHEVYAFSEDNLELIVGYSSAISDSSRCIAVLKSLFEEMGNNDPKQKQALKLISLAQEYDKEDLICNSTDTTLREDWVRRIEMASADVFIRSMEKGDFQKNKNVRKLLDALFDLSPKIFDNVMKRLMDATYGKVDVRFILSNMFNCNTTPQSILGISNLFWKIKESGKIYESDLIIEVASNLSALHKREDFRNLKINIIQYFEEVINSLPKCVRNVFFGQSVCFWNKARNAFLQAADEKLNYDTERRRVLTTTASKGLPLGARWTVVRQGSDILFRSKQYPKEFLYFADFEFNTKERFVFSWITGENRDSQSAFKIELLDDESCYLKSSRYNEYMHASETKLEKDATYSYVFASKGGKAGGLDSAFAWQIKDC